MFVLELRISGVGADKVFDQYYHSRQGTLSFNLLRLEGWVLKADWSRLDGDLRADQTLPLI